MADTPGMKPTQAFSKSEIKRLEAQGADALSKRVAKLERELAAKDAELATIRKMIGGVRELVTQVLAKAGG